MNHLKQSKDHANFGIHLFTTIYELNLFKRIVRFRTSCVQKRTDVIQTPLPDKTKFHFDK